MREYISGLTSVVSVNNEPQQPTHLKKRSAYVSLGKHILAVPLEQSTIFRIPLSKETLQSTTFKGAGGGGVPWVQIMENEFECLVVKGGDGGHFAEKFVKKYCS